MKSGDLVRIRKTAIDHYSTNWFIWHAEHKTPLLIVEELNRSYVKVLKPDGNVIHMHRDKLTTRMY